MQRIRDQVALLFTKISTYQGFAESTNKIIIGAIKKKLGEQKTKWVKKLPMVEWAYRTTAQTSISETSFSLTYGAQVTSPIKIEALSLWVEYVSPEGNEIRRSIDLDTFDEVQSEH